MAFTFAAFSYIMALTVDAFLIFFAIFHVCILFLISAVFRTFSKLSKLRPIDNCFRRVEDGLQEPHRSVQQPQPSGVAGVHHAHIFQHVVLVCRRVVLPGPQRPPDRLPHPQVRQEAGHVRAGTLRPHLHHERGRFEQMSEGRLDQACVLSTLVFLLSLWVRDL